MKHELNTIKVNIEKGDFGQMGFSLNPFDWFGKEEISKDQAISKGNTFISNVYNQIKPNYSYSEFIRFLKLDNWGEPITDEDYQDFLSTIGYNITESPDIGKKVNDAIVERFIDDKNRTPTRKSIMSAFINPDNVNWTYWDAIKTTTTEAVSEVKEGVQTAYTTISTGLNLIGPVIFLSLVGIGYFIYTQRKVVKERLTEKALTKIGLGK